MIKFSDFILEMNVHDLGDGFTVHNHDLGDGHHLMVTFNRSNDNGVETHFMVHTPEKPEGTTEVGHLPRKKATSTIMKVRQSIRNHLGKHETHYIDMYGTTPRQREAYKTIGRRMGELSKLGNKGGIRVHLQQKK
jgi:hypothetical protein